jgi:hypothetical protein
MNEQRKYKNITQGSKEDSKHFFSMSPSGEKKERPRVPHSALPKNFSQILNALNLFSVR